MEKIFKKIRAREERDQQQESTETEVESEPPSRSASGDRASDRPSFAGVLRSSAAARRSFARRRSKQAIDAPSTHSTPAPPPRLQPADPRLCPSTGVPGPPLRAGHRCSRPRHTCSPRHRRSASNSLVPDARRQQPASAAGSLPSAVNPAPPLPPSFASSSPDGPLPANPLEHPFDPAAKQRLQLRLLLHGRRSSVRIASPAPTPSPSATASLRPSATQPAPHHLCRDQQQRLCSPLLVAARRATCRCRAPTALLRPTSDRLGSCLRRRRVTAPASAVCRPSLLFLSKASS
ncbi:vegetative cell wall protein gp1-like [Eucalyptus grandis]|uniref:vegetative cell wall protein gp1-like n=1 Tax=Eucalyptus grandis TaxID=71139 RepID=UPI00192EE4CD|nr:vegetative cell wall protein gp1-like [Eucalyptus grandis]